MISQIFMDAYVVHPIRYAGWLSDRLDLGDVVLELGGRYDYFDPRALFAKTPGVRVLSDGIEQELWEKWVMIAAGSAITSLMRGAIAQVLRADGGRQFVESVIAEVEAVAAATKRPLRQAFRDLIAWLLLDPQSPWAASMASAGSDLPVRRRVWRLGRSTSTTSMPAPRKNRARPAP